MTDPIDNAIRAAALAIEARNTPQHALTWGDCLERGRDAVAAFLRAYAEHGAWDGDPLFDDDLLELATAIEERSHD